MPDVEFDRHGSAKGSRKWLAKLRRWWMPSVTNPKALLEVFVGIAAIVLFCVWLNPSDPLLLGFGFPWLATFALMFALRYGALLGATAGGCLLAAWWWFYGGTALFPRAYFSGLFVTLILAGHFSDRWSDRIEREASTNRYLNGRLASLTTSHYLLRVSHDRVEKELLSQPTTLRDTIHKLRVSLTSTMGISNHTQYNNSLPEAQEFLDYTASIAQINDAAIFAACGGSICDESSAHVGDNFKLDQRDPLLTKAIETGQLVHLREASNTHSAYLVCIPIRTATGELLGILVIRRMFFMSLNHDMLQLLLVMQGYYADSTRQQPMIAAIQQKVPGCPEDMALEIARLSHLTRTGGPASHLVALAFNKQGAEEVVYAQMVRQRRGLDLVWAFETAQARVMIVLLALTGKNGVDGYVTRMESILRAQFGMDFSAAHVSVYGEAIDAHDPGVALNHFMGHWANA